MVEAVIESKARQAQCVSAAHDAVEDHQAVLASNTSSIPIMKLAMATKRPSQVVGIHSSIRFPCCR